MDPVPVTGSHRKSGLLLASAKAAGDHDNGYEQPFRNRGAPMPGVRPHTGGKRFVCLREGCGRWFSRSGYLQQHLRVHTGEKPFVCSFEGCGQAFKRSDYLTKHRLTHTGEKPFVCSREGCGQAFQRSDSLTIHRRRHTGEKPFVCSREGCGQAFRRSDSLTVHRRPHTGEKPFVCSYEGCKWAFKQSSHLKYHLRAVHIGEKTFVCPYEGCGQAFRRSDSLTVHRRRHTGEKPFVCSFEGCQCAFKQASHLKYHLRAAHTGEKPFVCPYGGCKWAFKQSIHLKYHLRAVHTGAKPFVCSLEGCGRLFTRRHLLAGHLRCCTKAGAFVRSRKDHTDSSTPPRASLGHSLACRENPLFFPRAETGKQLPVTTQHPPSPVCAAEVACRDAPGDPSPASIATAFLDLSEPCDRSRTPSDREEQRSPWLSLPPAPLLPAAQLAREQWPSATGGMSDWLTWSAEDSLFGDGLPVFRSSASGLEAPSLLFMDDDQAFWQALIYPATGEP